MKRVILHDSRSNPWVAMRDIASSEALAKLSDSEAGAQVRFHDVAGTSPIQLFEIHYPANAQIKVHAHDEEEIIWVAEGEIRLGRRAFGPGSSVYIAANTLYSFSAGPDGLHMLNFRPRADYSMISPEEYAQRRHFGKMSLLP